MLVIVNGLFTRIARKFFVFTCEKYVRVPVTSRNHFAGTSVIWLNKLLNTFVYTMPPKRKNTQTDAVKSEKVKAVEEVPSRPKRNRVVTSYNEEYSDEAPKTTKAKSKNAGDAKDKKTTKEPENNAEVKVKGKRGRKKKVVEKQDVDADDEAAVKAPTGRKHSKDDDADDPEEEVEKKATAQGRKNKAEQEEQVDEDEAAKKDNDEDDDDDDVDAEDKDEIKAADDEVEVAKGRKKKDEEKPKKNGKEVGKKAAANKTTTAYEEINFDDCTRKNENGKEWNFKISNWNVDGIRAWINKGGLEYIEREQPDVFCVQETKCSEDKLPAEAKEVDGYKVYWICSEKDGYAGVGLYSKLEPISVKYGLNEEEHDHEGRLITAEFDKFYVVSVYVPNSGRGLVTLPKRLKWNEAFRKFVAELDKNKPVIICGDMNVSHLEIDLSNPKINTKNAGFTKEERDGMTEFLSDGYVDTFRKIYPDKTQAYTFWTYMSNCRAKNIGWRLDYFIVSERFMENVCDNIIRNQVFGSDHCPITLFLNV